jgi:hypothetical protein
MPEHMRYLEGAGGEALHLQRSLGVVGDRGAELIAHHDHGRGAEQERDHPGDDHPAQVPLTAQQSRIEKEREGLDRYAHGEQPRPGRGAAPVACQNGRQNEESGHEIEAVQGQRADVDQRAVEHDVGEDHHADGVDPERGEHPPGVAGQGGGDQDDDCEVEDEHLPHEAVDEPLGAVVEVDRSDQDGNRERRILDLLVLVGEVA